MQMKNRVLVLAAAAVVGGALYFNPAFAAAASRRVSPMDCPNNICDVVLFNEYMCGSGSGCGCIDIGDQQTCKNVE